MIVRRATIDDLPELLRLGELMRRESLEVFPEIDPAYTRKIAESALGITEYAVFILEDDGVIGMLTCLSAGNVFSPERYALNDLIFIQPDKRGIRAFKMLLDAYVSWADERGLHDKRLSVGTRKDLSPLMSRFGFRPIGMNFRRVD